MKKYLLPWKAASIQVQLIFNMLALGLLPMVVLAVVMDRASNQMIERDSSAQLQAFASGTADLVDRSLFERYGDVQAFAFNPMALGNPPQISQCMNFYMKAYGCYDLMILADTEGKVLATNTTRLDGSAFNPEDVMSRSVRSEEWFIMCKSGKIKLGQSYYSNAVEDAKLREWLGGSGLTMKFAAPVFDETGKLVRVWCNYVSWDRLIIASLDAKNKALREVGGQSVSIQLIDNRGMLLYDQDPRLIARQNLSESNLDAAQQVIAGKSGYTIENNPKLKVDQVNGFTPCVGYDAYKGNGWGVLVRQDLSATYASAITLRKYSFLISSFAAILVLFFAFGLARKLSMPLVQMKMAQQRLANGDLSKPLAVTRDDEIGQTQEEYNRLITTISNSLGIKQVDWVKLGAQRGEMARLMSMVDQAPINVMFAGTDGIISYVNTATITTFKSLERYIPVKADQVLGSNIDIFHKDPKHQRKILADPKNLPHKAQFSVGPEILDLQANAVMDESGKYIGSMVTWAVISQKIAMEKQIQETLEREKREAASTADRVAQIKSVVTAISAGDFTAQLPPLGEDAVGQIAVALNQAIASVRGTLQQVSGVAGGVATASASLSSSSSSISNGAQDSAASLEETASSLEQITLTVKQNCQSAQQARDLAVDSSSLAEGGGQVVQSAVAAMAEINAASKKIAEIITAIDEIAFQTNLLALNAAVEAARAGEQGRGFAVVATEVRNLAQRSAAAAKEIKGLIRDSVTKVENGSELVNQSGKTLTEIVASVRQVTKIISEIATASQDQSHGIEQINKAISQMDKVVQGNAAQTEELSSTADQLSLQASQLQQLVARFKLDQGMSAAEDLLSSVTASVKPVASPKSSTKLPRLNRGKTNGTMARAQSPSSGGGTDGYEEF